jgi:putative tryptophan/tyrosine transport system substrate-binding protein
VIDRRAFVGVAVVALATLGRASAQAPGKVHRVGWIATRSPSSDPAVARIWNSILGEFGRLGYVEGKNLAFEMRAADGEAERYPELAADLARLKVDVIVVGTDAGVRAAKAATAQIPIVMYGVTDPVGFGVIASYARPGGNVTGLAEGSFSAIHLKRLELLKAIAPKVKRVVWLQGNFHGLDAAQREVRRKEIEAGNQALGASVPSVYLNVREDFERARAEVLRERPDALILSPNPINRILRNEIAAFALEHRLPAVGGGRAHVEAGLLAGFGPGTPIRDLVGYVDKILRGAKPGDLAVVESSTFDLSVNLRTAAALGLTVPESVLVRAAPDAIVR